MPGRTDPAPSSAPPDEATIIEPAASDQRPADSAATVCIVAFVDTDDRPVAHFSTFTTAADAAAWADGDECSQLLHAWSQDTEVADVVVAHVNVVTDGSAGSAV